MADFFTTISDGFDALGSEDVPIVTQGTNPIVVTVKETVERIRECKKPSGLLYGDVFPALLTEYAKMIAVPLTMVMNICFEQGTWPSAWRQESVSVIPKVQAPSGLNELRNISCTSVFSKIMEFF